jgi:hypothetical protein
VLQPEARGLDRLFRLYREDQLMSMRAALADCHSDTPSGPRPIVLANVAIENMVFARSHAPVCMLSFDVPERLLQLTTDQMVRQQLTHCAPVATWRRVRGTGARRVELQRRQDGRREAWCRWRSGRSRGG